MSDVCRNWLVIILACGAASACNTTSDLPQRPPRTQVGAIVPAEDAGATDDRDADVSAEQDAGQDETAETPKTPVNPPKNGGKTPGKTSGKPSSADAGSPDAQAQPPKNLPPVAGTADASNCYSYTPASGGMCSSFYCGVTSEQLTAEASSSGHCKDTEFACTSDVSNVTSKCARRIESTMIGAPQDKLRSAIRDCVFQDEEIRAHVETECLDCFLDVLECSAGACLVACLGGDSPQCDQCARKAGCFDPIFACTGLPSPL